MFTKEDVYEALNDDRHGGWGLATAAYSLSDSIRERLYAAVAAVANELGLDEEDFFLWTNSKSARWLVDSIPPSPPTRATVRKYLNVEAIERLQAEGAF